MSIEQPGLFVEGAATNSVAKTGGRAGHKVGGFVSARAKNGRRLPGNRKLSGLA